MKACPHCNEQIANLASICPHCREAVEARSVLAARAVAAAQGTPDHGTYIVAGLVAVVVGFLIVVGAAGNEAGSGADTWLVVGLGIGAIGGAIMLVGVIGLGVYIGMRQFDLWQKAESRTRE